MLWLAVETNTKYNVNKWHFKNAAPYVANEPLIRSSGFGRLLLASIQHHYMIMQNNKEKNLLVLQSTDDTFYLFYNGLQFSTLTKEDKNYNNYKSNLTPHFIDDKKLRLYKCNCRVNNVNPSIYENNVDVSVLEEVKNHILSLYFNAIGISYKMN